MINPQLQKMAEIVKAKYRDLLTACPDLTLNALIVEEYKQAAGANDFRTFKDWKDSGMIVKKGEKGFPVFSKPVRPKQTEEQEEGKKGPVFFHTAHLFNELQVEPITTKQ